MKKLTALLMLTPAFAFAQASNWNTSIGLIGMYLPKYQGNSHYRFLVVPNLSVTYKKRFFVSAAKGLGMYFTKSKHWKTGASIQYDYSNGTKRDKEFPGLNNIKNLFSLNGFINVQYFPVNLGVNWRRGLSRWDLGNQLTFSARGELPISQSFFVMAGPSITLADHDYMQTYYGINSAQSASSGLSEHKVNAGISRINLGASLFYNLNKQWSGALIVNATRYVNTAEKSPMIQHKVDWFIGMGVSYQLSGVRSRG